jgi:hypothetical protein
VCVCVWGGGGGVETFRVVKKRRGRRGGRKWGEGTLTRRIVGACGGERERERGGGGGELKTTVPHLHPHLRGAFTATAAATARHASWAAPTAAV